MTTPETEAILTICLMAAFADGTKGDAERERFKSIMTGLGSPASPEIFQNVVLKRVALKEVAAKLGSDESKTLAYEMAVYVCDADGLVNEQEKAFLTNLKNELKIGSEAAEQTDAKGAALATVPVADQEEVVSAAVSEAEISKMILNYAILNGALELLPQSFATMAIIPLQMKMVYRIGKKFGYELDSGHIKEFIATVGLGLTSQVLEGYARKLIGGLAKQFIGKVGRGIASAATGAAFSFGSTYAIGKVAYLYYAGGRKLDAAQLKSMFARFSEESKSLYNRYQGDIQEKARSVNVNELIPMIKGNRVF